MPLSTTGQRLDEEADEDLGRRAAGDGISNLVLPINKHRPRRWVFGISAPDQGNAQ